MSNDNPKCPTQSIKIAIAATFTAEPLEQSLAFWTRKVGTPAEIVFAPPNQVFQQLLDPSGLLATNRQGINILLVRFEDWQRDDSGIETKTAEKVDFYHVIERGARELIRALTTSIERSPAPHLLCFCPASQIRADDSQRVLFSKRIEEWVKWQLREVGAVYVVTAEELAATYPVAEYYDPYADHLAQIPYTDVFFAALGTMIARTIYDMNNVRYKVIVLDCDQTLWAGVCGEDGPLGIQIDPGRRAIQEFMVRQHDAGMLLCLCSKNNEADVFEVFDSHPGMPLKRNHIVSWRINWRPKSENIKSLAQELNLGLDSFVFIDDDPLECAEVQANCTAVLTLELPQDTATILRFLRHIWAFDHLKVTEEARERTALYRQNSERERFLREALALENFLAGLGLEVQISVVVPHQLARVSELTQRTTQFNATTFKRSEAEIQNLLQCGGQCLTVHVRDRFGDYGLVGVIIFKVNSGALVVDTFLLSCRALGRGVEHRMLTKLGEVAKERGLNRIDVLYFQTRRNQPALDFLESVGNNFKERSTGGFLFKFPVGFATQLTHSPKVAERASDLSTELTDSLLPAGEPSSDTQARAAMLKWIAAEMYDAAQIHRFTSRQTRTQGSLRKTFVAPRSPIEKNIAQIISELLDIEQVGILDNFFELGGESLQAIRLLSRIRDILRVEITLHQLFERPTIGDLSLVIEKTRSEGTAVKLPAIRAISRQAYRVKRASLEVQTREVKKI